MTEKLYWQDSYLKEFDAEVKAVEGEKVILDKTAFYPRSGGQPGDRGEINGIKVVDTFYENGEIVHLMPGHNLSVGTIVHGKIDWDRRYRLMRMHTAAHVISQVMYNETGALITGNQLDVDKSRIDYNLEEFDREKMIECIQKANEIIEKNLPVKTYFLKREEALKIPQITKLAIAKLPNEDVLRIVEIVGFDIQADGGTHVKSLKEVGKIVLLKMENKGKSNRRLYYTLE